MIRINRLLRTAKFIQKLPARGGPGWDRPDVPPSAFVDRDTRVLLLLIKKFSILKSKLYTHSLIHQCHNSSSHNHKYMKEVYYKLFLNSVQFGV